MSDLIQEKWVAQLSEDDNAVVVDVRTAEERADGFVANSIHMDIYQPQEFMKSLEGLDKSKTITSIVVLEIDQVKPAPYLIKVGFKTPTI